MTRFIVQSNKSIYSSNSYSSKDLYLSANIASKLDQIYTTDADMINHILGFYLSKSLLICVDNMESKKQRKSGYNFEELLNKEWSILTKAEYSELQAAFKKTDQRNGGITFYDLVNIIRTVGIPISEQRKDKINKDIANKEIRILTFEFLLNTAASLKKERDENYKGDIPQENEYLDAFVALGGIADKSGYVNKSALMEIVKRQFQLSLDFQNMIEGLQGENLDYDVFCSIFEQDRQNNQGRLASAASQRSMKSQASAQQLKIEQRDFQKFLSHYQNDDS